MDRDQLKKKMINDLAEYKRCIIPLDDIYQLFCYVDYNSHCYWNYNETFWNRHINLIIDNKQTYELGIIKEQCKVDKEMFLEKIDEILDKYERMIEEKNAEEEPCR